jgi:hypothetical protein
LGGLLGLLGGEVFGIGLVIVIGIWYGNGEETSFQVEVLEFLRSFLSWQLFTALPGILFGFIVGGILGIPFAFISDRFLIWKQVVLSVLGAAILHFFIVRIFSVNGISFGHVNLYDEYLDFLFLILPIYLIAAILYGYYFPNFKPRWPKFLRMKQPQTD